MGEQIGVKLVHFCMRKKKKRCQAGAHGGEQMGKKREKPCGP